MLVADDGSSRASAIATSGRMTYLVMGPPHVGQVSAPTYGKPGARRRETAGVARLTATPVANSLDPGGAARLAGAMRMLVLGGTAWLGHTVALEALRRGHDVTALARGSADPPAGAAFVVRRP